MTALLGHGRHIFWQTPQLDGIHSHLESSLDNTCWKGRRKEGIHLVIKFPNLLKSTGMKKMDSDANGWLWHKIHGFKPYNANPIPQITQGTEKNEFCSPATKSKRPVCTQKTKLSGLSFLIDFGRGMKAPRPHLQALSHLDFTFGSLEFLKRKMELAFCQEHQ